MRENVLWRILGDKLGKPKNVLYIIHNENMHKGKNARINNNNLKVSTFLVKTLIKLDIAMFLGVDKGWTRVDKIGQRRIGIGEIVNW